MHWLEELRKKFGIPQNALAVFFGISRTTVAMTELSKRDLPTSAMLQLEPFLSNAETPLTGPLAKRVQQYQVSDAALAQKNIDRQLKESQLILTRTQQKLAAMQYKYSQAMLALQLAQRLTALPAAAGKEAERRQAFINSLQANAFKALNDNGVAAQAILKRTIKMHEVV